MPSPLRANSDIGKLTVLAEHSVETARDGVVAPQQVIAALLATKTPEQALADMQNRLTDAAMFQ